MPNFDFKGIRIAKYSCAEGAVSYSEHMAMGDAMSCNLALRFAEGRLYAEGGLAEYLKKAVGGTISIGVKYIPDKAQIMMFGAEESTHQVSEKPVKGIAFTEKSTGQYVGCTMYAADMVDGKPCFTCLFVPRVLFGPPGYVFQTLGESIVFQTPTTSGEFVRTEDTKRLLLDAATVDTEEEAIAWGKVVLGEGA